MGDDLRRAVGMPTKSRDGFGLAAQLVLCGALGLVATVAIQLVSGTPPVALAFGLLAAYAPIAVVSGRARRRQREFAQVWPEAVDNLTSAVRAGLSLPDALRRYNSLGARVPGLSSAFNRASGSAGRGRVYRTYWGAKIYAAGQTAGWVAGR